MDATQPIRFRMRPAAEADARLLWLIRTDAIRVGCRELYSPDQLTAWTSVRMPDGFVAAIGECVFLVAEAEDALLGFAFMTLATSTVEGIFVAPSSHRRGVGAVLLRELERRARESGLTRLSLSSTLNAEPFYASNGYRALERTTWMHPNGFDLLSISMEKVLAIASRRLTSR